MKKIVLIACSSKKRTEKSMAKDLYISPLFKYSSIYDNSVFYIMARDLYNNNR